MSRATVLLSLFIAGCASFGNADVCIKGRGVNVEVPFGGGKYVPPPCRSRDIYHKLFGG